ncbi:uncharacterized protein B0P05DRAFT_531069 [Gilbertella persicaria]|uniref:uncharacterized protein n=1 Tax=Gilbertella persicaria TaxID=101096 RepID=UPI0022204FB5|nr:uncharacterized protein B0P05DRAFT_531069 [Gilbertella persicaria]KAI8088002.1 hypothetical protein B0P05DRAFT_531069 [Gilbertella persicaria]
MRFSHFLSAALAIYFISANHAASIYAQDSTSIKGCDLQFNVFYWKFITLQKNILDFKEQGRPLNTTESEHVLSTLSELDAQMINTQKECCSSENSFDPDALVMFKAFTLNMANTTVDMKDSFEHEIPLSNEEQTKVVVGDLGELHTNLTDLNDRCFV